ncbi:hypothetical protein CGERO_06760 [Corynebacterium gerontici]|uniref:Uncharacterized protein n=1 Tax=Corynebacterium gerontici TaxID=2079234 RepID=A0A3G6J118_9CORY|nr:hypothetical protein CGERO_06760 [Corynebacterium gerontici]
MLPARVRTAISHIVPAQKIQDAASVEKLFLGVYTQPLGKAQAFHYQRNP